jgi:mandelamide amidase
MPIINRREFMETSALAALAAGGELASTTTAFGAAIAASDENMPALTAVDAIAAIRQGEIGAENYARALLSRAERFVDLHTYIALNRDGLMESARAVDMARKKGQRLGRLAGLPLLVKDNIDTRGLPTTAGTTSLANNRPKQDAPVLRPLFSAGALLMAKMNLHELAAGITSTNAVYGAVRNPYDPKLIPGGSSGGTAAGIAAHIAPAGLGSDTGGSMRIPPALCGVVGLRPTVADGRKRYSTKGVVPISHTWDTVGPMGRTVGDVALLDSVISNQPAPRPITLKGLRLGVPRAFFWENLDSELADVAQSALERLRSAGAVLVEVDMSYVRDHNLDAVPLYEIEGDIKNYLAAAGGNISFGDLVSQIASKDVAGLFAVAKTIPKAAYDAAKTTGRPQLQKSYAD